MSSNEEYSERSMNGIISVYAADINCNSLDANSINVDDITINNSMIVNSTTLLPVELQQLTGVSTSETIQQQIDQINTDLNNYVDLSSNQNIAGVKDFTQILELTGDMRVATDFSPSEVDLLPQELAVLTGIDTSQPLSITLQQAGVSGLMTLDTDQVALGYKSFENSIQLPSIFSQQNTGTINGYFIDTTNFIYTTKVGSFTTGVSIINGTDCFNKTLATLTTSPNTGSISTATTPKAALFTYSGYIESTNQVYTINDFNVVADMGLKFSGNNDFVGSITNNLITLQITTGLTPSSTAKSGTIVSIGGTFYINTDNAFDVFDFIECANSTDPTQITANPYTNLYLLNYPVSNPTSTFLTDVTGFLFNNKVYINSSATNWGNAFPLDTAALGSNNIQYGTQMSYVGGTLNSVYSLSLSPSIQSSITELFGFNNGGLYIFDLTGLSSPSNRSLLLNGTDNQAFISSIGSNNELNLSFDRLPTTSSTSVKSYVKDLTGTPFILTPSSQQNKYSSKFYISLVGSFLGGFSYQITSPNTITADSPSSTFSQAYQRGPTTLYTRTSSSLSVGDWVEINSSYGYYISSVVSAYEYVTTNNANVNSQYTANGVITLMGSTYTFFYGNSTAPAINDAVINTLYANDADICFLSALTGDNNFTSNSLSFSQTLNLPPSLKTSRENKDFRFIYYLGQYIINCDNPSAFSVNDIIVFTNSRDDNSSKSGEYITSVDYGVNSTELPEITTNVSRANNTSAYRTEQISYSTKNSPYFTALMSKFSSGQIPQQNDFMGFTLDGGVQHTYITNVTDNGTSYFFYTNFRSSNTSTTLYVSFYDPVFSFTGFPPSLQVLTQRIYEPSTFEIITPSQLDVYSYNNAFYTAQTYDVFENQTIPLYQEISMTEHDKIDLAFYSNNAYSASSLGELLMPATSLQDTLVANDVVATLSQKTFSDDTTFQQDIDVVDVRATGVVSGASASFTGNVGCVDVNATGNVGCVDVNATGDVDANNVNITTKLDAGNNTQTHELGDCLIGSTIGNNDYQGITFTDSTNNTDYMIIRNTSSGNTLINYIEDGTTGLYIRGSNNNRMVITEDTTRLYNQLYIYQESAMLFGFQDGTSLTNSFVGCGLSFYSLPTGFSVYTVGVINVGFTNNSGRTVRLMLNGCYAFEGYSASSTRGVLFGVFINGTRNQVWGMNCASTRSNIISVSLDIEVDDGDDVSFESFADTGSGTITCQNDNTRKSNLRGIIY
jgi:hypothetical protein